MSTATDMSSLPDLPEDLSCGSSVSTKFVQDYEEILKHAIVAPRFQIGEDVYRQTIAIINGGEHDKEDQVRETFEENSSSESSSHYKVDIKINEAKQAVEKKRKVEKKQLRFNVPNALDSLLECTNTPTKNAMSTPMFQESDSANSTPEVGNIISPPSVDKDLIRMDSLMDEWNLQLKQNVLAELADMKTRQYQYQENAITEIRSRHNTETLRFTHEVESLKELLHSFEKNVKQKDEVINNLTQALGKQKEKSDKIRLFSMWRLKHTDEERQHFSAKMADKFYKRTLSMKVWSGWRSVVENRWKQRVEKACQIKSQEVCITLTQDYEERLQALQKELNSARSEIAKMHTERDSYEENMKKAFMRGVCALNMEAMSMFNEGGTPDDDIRHDSRPATTHHPCTTFNNFVSNGNSHNNNNICVDEQTSQQHLNETKKHVTFTSSTHNTTAKKPMNKSTNRNLHVKMTGKSNMSRKDGLTGPSNQSSISSIKVERHVPLDTPSTYPKRGINASVPPHVGMNQQCMRKPLNSVPTVKVVD